jgi:hypothetical protein
VVDDSERLRAIPRDLERSRRTWGDHIHQCGCHPAPILNRFGVIHGDFQRCTTVYNDLQRFVAYSYYTEAGSTYANALGNWASFSPSIFIFCNDLSVERHQRDHWIREDDATYDFFLLRLGRSGMLDGIKHTKTRSPTCLSAPLVALKSVLKDALLFFFTWTCSWCQNCLCNMI